MTGNCLKSDIYTHSLKLGFIEGYHKRESYEEVTTKKCFVGQKSLSVIFAHLFKELRIHMHDESLLEVNKMEKGGKKGSFFFI